MGKKTRELTEQPMQGVFPNRGDGGKKEPIPAVPSVWFSQPPGNTRCLQYLWFALWGLISGPIIQQIKGLAAREFLSERIRVSDEALK